METNPTFQFNPDSFTPEQREVLALLAEGASVTAAARVRAIHRTTIHHWMRRTPGFRDAVLSAREEACARRREQLLDAAHAAIEYLHDTIKDKSAPHPVRTRIAFSLLKLRVVNGSMLETAAYGQSYLMPMPQDLHKIKDNTLRKQSENALAGVLSRRNQRADAYEYPPFQAHSSDSSHSSLFSKNQPTEAADPDKSGRVPKQGHPGRHSSNGPDHSAIAGMSPVSHPRNRR